MIASCTSPKLRPFHIYACTHKDYLLVLQFVGTWVNGVREGTGEVIFSCYNFQGQFSKDQVCIEIFRRSCDNNILLAPGRRKIHIYSDKLQARWALCCQQDCKQLKPRAIIYWHVFLFRLMLKWRKMKVQLLQFSSGWERTLRL